MTALPMSSQDAQARAEREIEKLKDRNATLEQQLRDTHDGARREVVRAQL
jgi:cell division protein FtsB